MLQKKYFLILIRLTTYAMTTNAMTTYQELSEKELKKIIYPSAPINTPFGKKKVIYADFIASGCPSPLIENYIIKNIYPHYSNTHSNASNGIYMKNEIENVKTYIKKEYNIDDNYEILFKGSGVTTCINYLINCFDYSKYKKVYIFITEYEHYSNHLPFVELEKENENIHLYIIPLFNKNEKKSPVLNIKWFETKIHNIYNTTPKRQKTLIITSVSHCSNLTGYYTPVYELKNILKSNSSCKSNCDCNIKQYFFTDAACSSPYAKIDGSIFDAIFISPHKFIGGVETPGLLVAKTCLFEKNHSLNPGGSCIKTTHHNSIVYSNDIEVRESAGTPNIIGIIKIGQCLSLKHYYQKLIDYNETILSSLIRKYKKLFSSKYDNFKCIDFDDNVKFLPIFSFHLTNLHYNFIVVLLNDLYGIQSRGGKSCTGLLNDYMKENYGYNGFCRISFHWTMNKKQIRYIFNSIEKIIQSGEKYLNQYDYNKNNNLFTYKKSARKHKYTNKNI